MSLAPGTRIGSYEIASWLGAGGMGEVYKAHDTKLGRDVAIKVLPEAFSQDKERLARFEREARLLASLNHPNIATIHGLEESEGVHFLVLELVPGETLADRIKRGRRLRQGSGEPGMPLDEALPLFKQIAEALEAAHEKGVIHRDLKPANIKVTPEGKIKVLDFGLARAFTEEALPHDLSSSPTLTRQATQAGVILGTAAYMSPEQARGKHVDKRTDVWAFGCCFYEVLTGRTPFGGETVTDILAAVVKSEPDWQALPDTTPWKVRELIGRCLRKDPGRRLQYFADARIDIDDALSEPSIELPPAKKVRRGVAARVALFTTVAAIVGILVGRISMQPPPPEEEPVTRFVVSIPPDQSLGGPSLPFAMSPDGRRLVYIAENGAIQQLYLRELEDFEAKALPGTEGASSPFFSPDGQWVGFYADGNLKKVSVSRRAVVTLCRAPPLYLTAGFGGGSFWGRDDTILFSDDTRGLLQVSADGGTPEPVTDPRDSEGHLWPQMLPDGGSLLFTIFDYASGTSRLSLLSMETGESRALLPGSVNAYQARYLPTGHLVYAQSSALWAVPFDVSSLEPRGSPVSVLDAVHETAIGITGPTAYFAVADMGSLVYVPGRAVGARSLVWVNRQGREIPWTEEGNERSNPRLSPDGTRVAVSVASPEGADIWVYEVDRGTRTRLTFGGFNLEPIWSPDGARIAFAGPANVHWIPGDGSGTPQILVQVEGAPPAPSSWSPDGRILAFYEINPKTARDIWVMPLDGDGKPTPILVTEFNEHSPMFSPNGGWLAYVSDESGREEVYVRPYPGPGAKHPVSSEGGREPVWSAHGKELFFRNGNKMMVAAVETDAHFIAGTPKVLFEGPYAIGSGGGNNYDVTPDGKRFLMVRRELGPAPREIHVVLNWAEELKRLVPTN